ncbi:MAG: hypothetical protein K2K06_05285 [Oscillospiraceae bacterium]|nr:hypothetical protein [Oscillospiraceae bacterium]
MESKEIEKKEVNQEYNNLSEADKSLYQNVVEMISLLLKYNQKDNPQ